MRPAPVLTRTPGDRVRAADWNEMQIKLESALSVHAHALDAQVLDSSSKLRGRHLRAESLHIAGRPLAAPLEEAATKAGERALARHLPVEGGVISGDLTVEGNLHVRGDLVVDGALSVGGEAPREERPLRRGTPRQFRVSGAPGGGSRPEYTPVPGTTLRFDVETLSLGTFGLRFVAKGNREAEGYSYYSFSCMIHLKASFNGRLDTNSARFDSNTLRLANRLQGNRTAGPGLGMPWGVHRESYRYYPERNGSENLGDWSSGHQTQTWLLDPGSWSFELYYTSYRLLDLAMQLDIFVLPLPELAP